MKGFPYSGADALAMSKVRLNNQEYKKRLNEQVAEDNKPSKSINAITGTPLPQIELAMLRKREGLGPREIQGEDDQSYEAHVTRKEQRVYKEPSKYWYKINGQRVSKDAYIKYENKPGGDEAGKQTNDPDPYGRKANNHGRGKKTK